MIGFNGGGFGSKTAAAGTVISRLVPPDARGFLRVSTLVATGANASHKVTALRSLGRTKATGVSAAASNTLPVASQPGPAGNPLAAGDLLAVRETDGVTRLYTVSAPPGSYPGGVTLASGLVAGVGLGSDVWDLGVPADTDPRTGEPHQAFQLPAAGQATFQDREGGVVATLARDEPVLFQHSNATAQGSIDLTAYTYTAE